MPHTTHTSNIGARQDDLLSIVVRTGETTGTGHLDETLFSLAVQTYNPIEVLVVCRPEEDSAIQNLLAKQPFHQGSSTRTVLFEDKAASGSGACKLNLGIQTSRGRYLAFLDQMD